MLHRHSGASAAFSTLAGLGASALLAVALTGCAGAPGLDLASIGGKPAADGTATATAEAQPEEKAPSETTDKREKPDGKTARGEAVPALAPAAKVATTTAPEPKDVRAALAESRKLKVAGKTKEALAVLEKAAKVHPSHRVLAVEQGLISLELGQAADAQKHLSKADSADAKDWRALSGLGIAHASQGQQAEAQRYFREALKIEPSNATILNNLAMSLILDRKIDEAETLLRKASADGGSAKTQVQRNLVLAQSLKAQQERQTSAAANGASSQSATP